MMAKDSVKSRLETGISYTEFTYQLVQGFDFYHLYKNKNCKIQMGGSDQWGNIVTGTELIRRKAQGNAFAITCPLITKADGGKFGKTESGSVWLDPEKTSPYKFYQFWINVSDADAAKYMRIFTLLSKDEIETLEKEHEAEPHLRKLQKALAEDITIRVHSKEDLEMAIGASEILFSKKATDALKTIDEIEISAKELGLKRKEFTREKAIFLEKEKHLLTLKEKADSTLEEVKKDKWSFIQLRADKQNVVKYLKSKVDKARDQIGKFVAQVSLLKNENIALKKEVNTLVRVNEKLTYQNELRAVALKRDRNEMFELVNLVATGNTNEVIEKYNNNNKEYTL